MSAANAALRSLYDCSVIRTRFDHDGMLVLYERGMADSQRVPDEKDAFDWRLTSDGKTLAECMFA